MEYRQGKPGRVFVARFSDGDDLLEGIKEIARNENIRAGVFQIVGGMKGGEFVVGPKSEKMPPEPNWRSLTESHEVFGSGTIFWKGDEPLIHFHGAYGKGDSVKVGCLRKDSKVFLILEVVIMEIEGITAERIFDPETGLPLLSFL